MAKITNKGLHLTESASAISDSAGEGQIWVKSDTSAQSGCSLYYTSDIGIENRISGTTVSAEQATTSDTSIDFTGIPAGVTRVTLLTHSMSVSGGNEFLVQLGDSGGVETSGYLSRYGRISGTGAATEGSTAGLMIFNDDGPLLHEIVMDIYLQDAANNTWVGMFIEAVNSTTIMAYGGGSKSLNGTLDRIRLTTAAGSETFDAGAASIQFS